MLEKAQLWESSNTKQQGNTITLCPGQLEGCVEKLWIKSKRREWKVKKQIKERKFSMINFAKKTIMKEMEHSFSDGELDHWFILVGTEKGTINYIHTHNVMYTSKAITYVLC